MHPINRVTGAVVDAAYQIHTRLGPGLLESAYETILASVLTRGGFAVRRQVLLPVTYDGIEVEHAYKIDLLVEERVVVELKAVERTIPVFRKQLFTYLRLLDLPVGLLINFGVHDFREGVERIANFRASEPPPPPLAGAGFGP